MGFIHSHSLYDILFEAGIVTEPPERVAKLSIIIEAGQPVRIVTELYAIEAIKDLLVEHLHEPASA